jgi:N-acetyl-anhydromuramyl-L-alanine amidase AmpD
MVKERFPMTIGGMMIANEDQLLKDEGGEKMSGEKAVRYLVIHCSATRSTQSYSVEQLLRDHRARGFRTIGYHFYIRRDGTLTQHRGALSVGAHCRPYNRCSIGICYEGGLNADGYPADTRTDAQKRTMLGLLCMLHRRFPQAIIAGHRDMPGATPKDCPCFDAGKLLIQVLEA